MLGTQTKEAEDFSSASWLVPSPRYFANLNLLQRGFGAEASPDATAGDKADAAIGDRAERAHARLVRGGRVCLDMVGPMRRSAAPHHREGVAALLVGGPRQRRS